MANKTYEHCVQKRKVQSILFKLIGFFNGIATVLIGPTPTVYIEMLRKLGVSMIVGYENDKETNIQMEGNHRDINIVRDDIFNATPSSFMDIDTVRTVKYENYLLKHLFNEQKREINHSKKIFMFTVALRMSSVEEVKNFLSELLKDTIVELDPRVNLNEDTGEPIMWQYFFTTLNSSPYTITTISYKGEDKNLQNKGSRMLTVLIQY